MMTLRWQMRFFKVVIVMAVMLFGPFSGWFAGLYTSSLFIWLTDPTEHGFRSGKSIVFCCGWLGLALFSVGSVWLSLRIWRADW
jgi:hypothetical protein